MAESASMQLRLRRAFRYGYFAFLAAVVLLLAGIVLWVARLDAAMLVFSFRSSTVLMMIVLALGLCVPLFFASWLLIGTAVMGAWRPQSSLMDGVRD